jgi:hypothetical protein
MEGLSFRPTYMLETVKIVTPVTGELDGSGGSPLGGNESHQNWCTHNIRELCRLQLIRSKWTRPQLRLEMRHPCGSGAERADAVHRRRGANTNSRRPTGCKPKGRPPSATTALASPYAREGVRSATLRKSQRQAPGRVLGQSGCLAKAAPRVVRKKVVRTSILAM